MKKFTGLTSNQVSEKIQQGLTNDFTAKTSSSMSLHYLMP